MNKLNILLLSSQPIDHSANLVLDNYNALKEAGHNVDFGFPGFEQILSKYHSNESISCVRKLSNTAYYLINRILKRPFTNIKGMTCNHGLTMFITDEKKPYFDPDTFAKSIKKKYDVIIVSFMEGLISTATLQKIYESQHCLILLQSVDMCPMTGGCYYFNDCNNFENQCYNCKIFNGRKKSKAHSNYIFKKEVYEKCNIVYCCNTWMKQFALKSGLFSNTPIEVKSTTINEDFYKPLDVKILRKKYNIPENKKFILGLRHRNLERKGGVYAEQSIKTFLKSFGKEQLRSIAILTIGENCDWNLGCDIINWGIVDAKRLVEFYNCCSIFLCPSVDDAGPSMINQSQMCGTPVVAFNSGAAVDVVITGETGYKAEYRNADDLANGISFFYKMPVDTYTNTRISTRNFAMGVNSKESFARWIEEMYIKYGNKTQ